MWGYRNSPQQAKRGLGFLHIREQTRSVTRALEMGSDIPKLQEALDVGEPIDYPASALTLRMDEKLQVSECPRTFFLLRFCFFPSSPFLLFIDGFLS
jgi:hypothetical protein